MREIVLAWNMGFKNSTTPEISSSRRRILDSLILEIQPSLLAIQEAPSNLSLLGYEIVPTTSGLLSAVNTATWQRLETLEFESRGIGLALRHVRTGNDLLFWNVHLSSALNGMEVVTRRAFVRDKLRPFLHRVRLPTRMELIVGDFNLPPYDEVIMQPGGLWANRCLEIVRHWSSRAVFPNLPLFNPTWALFGKLGLPGGTYYRTQDGGGEGPWHVIDQVLMSPFLGEVGRQQVRLLDRVGTVDLCRISPVRAPNNTVGSDHLPLEVVLAIN